jgi:hypothetical protein
MDKKNDYDRFARVYSNDAENNAFNALTSALPRYS